MKRNMLAAVEDYIEDNSQLDELCLEFDIPAARFLQLVDQYRDKAEAAIEARRSERKFPTIQLALDRAGYKKKRKYKMLSSRQVEEIIADYEKGKTLREMGEKFKVNPQTIVNNLKKAGVYKSTPRKAGALKPGSKAAADLISYKIDEQTGDLVIRVKTKLLAGKMLQEKLRELL